MPNNWDTMSNGSHDSRSSSLLHDSRGSSHEHDLPQNRRFSEARGLLAYSEAGHARRVSRARPAKPTRAAGRLRPWEEVWSWGTSSGLVIAPAARMGFYGFSERLWSYTPRQTWTLLGWLTARDLTVFTSTNWVVQIILCLGIATGLIWWPISARDLHLVLDLCTFFLESFSALIAFILGTFVQAAREAWKERRSNYVGLVSSSRYLLLQV